MELDRLKMKIWWSGSEPLAVVAVTGRRLRFLQECNDMEIDIDGHLYQKAGDTNNASTAEIIKAVNGMFGTDPQNQTVVTVPFARGLCLAI